MSKIYIVYCGDPDSSESYYVQGPEVNDWNQYVKGLWPEVKKRSLAKDGDVDAWDFAKFTVEILKEKGYEKVETAGEFIYTWRDEYELDWDIQLHNLLWELDLRHTPKEVECMKNKSNHGKTPEERYEILRTEAHNFDWEARDNSQE